MSTAAPERAISLPAGGATLLGDLVVPRAARALVLFAHGSGSGRRSPRNRQVAGALNRAELATLLFDLLTPAEAARDERTGELRFDIELLSQRLVGAVDWAGRDPAARGLPIGLFGASTGAAAALIAAAARASVVGAVVSRGGRADLAERALPSVRCPALLIVGGDDFAVLELNRRALTLLPEPSTLAVVPGAGHLFEEPGALDEVARLTAGWFLRFLPAEP
jgi:putative phosphoribosyl transferase